MAVQPQATTKCNVLFVVSDHKLIFVLLELSIMIFAYLSSGRKVFPTSVSILHVVSYMQTSRLKKVSVAGNCHCNW